MESNQGYVHYRKGSVTMYYLKEMIGEDEVNRALRKETPPQYQYRLKDLFEEMTLFSNRTDGDRAQAGRRKIRRDHRRRDAQV